VSELYIKSLEGDVQKLEASVRVLSRELEESRRMADSIRGEIIRTKLAIGRTEVAEGNTTLRDMSIHRTCVACGGHMRAGDDCAHCFMGEAGQTAKKDAPLVRDFEP
jgi:hypothetical protein